MSPLLLAAAGIMMLASASAQESSSEPSALDQDWARLEALLSARDDAFESAYLPYTATEVGLTPAPDPPKVDGEQAIESGWWAMDGERFAFSRTYQAERETKTHFVWNGARCTILHVQPELLEDPDLEPFAFPSLMTVHPHWVQREWKDAKHLPAELGLIFSNQRWDQWSESMAEFQVLGREDVDGADCLVVQFDFVGAGTEDDGVYVAPWVVWFDDRGTLLARKRTSFVSERLRPTTSDKPRLGPSRDFGGESFRPWSTWSLTGARQVNGGWIPAAGTYTWSTREGDRQLEIRVGEDATLNSGVPGHCFEFAPPPGTQLIDHVEGRNEKLSMGPHAGRGWSRTNTSSSRPCASSVESPAHRALRPRHHTTARPGP